MATSLGKISFHFNSKEKQCQRMFKVLHNYTHFTCQQDYAQNPSSQASKVCELRSSKCSSWIQKKAEEPEIKLPTSDGSWKKAREFQKNIYFCFINYAKTFDWVDYDKLWKILQEMGIPDHLICLLRNLYAGQEVTALSGHRTMACFQIGKGVRQGCILSPCLFTYMQSASCEMPGCMSHKLEP